MFENIRADARRYFAIDGWDQPSFVGRLFVLFFSYGFHATVVYRFGRSIEFFHRRVYLLPAYWFCLLFYHLSAWLCVKLYGIDICRDAVIEKGLYVGHFGGIKVAQCHIGEICNIHQLSQIGLGCKIGSHVWVGAHAVIADGVVIDDHATVTVAAMVNKTVASHTLVAGNPARAIKINFDNNGMLGINNEKNN